MTVGMKSPLPTSFASLLVALCAALVIFGTSLAFWYARQYEFPAQTNVQLGAAVINVVFFLGLLIYSTVGIAAGLRYRKERRTLNAIGLAGNALLLLAFGALLGFSLYTVREVQASRRLGSPIKTAERYQGE